MAHEPDDNVTYDHYLRLTDILAAQHPLGARSLGPEVHAAEHFFIVVHQAFELWFKQQLLDLGYAADALTPPDVRAEHALEHLERVAAIQLHLNTQMQLLDHLSPSSFLAFRGELRAASGADSAQFRAMQAALGIQGRDGSPVYDAFAAAIAQAGLTLEAIYRDPARAGALYRVAETLVDISERFWLMSAIHVRITERAIGDRPGTGGSSGVSFLMETLRRRAFPALWAVRTAL